MPQTLDRMKPANALMVSRNGGLRFDGGDYARKAGGSPLLGESAISVGLWWRNPGWAAVECLFGLCNSNYTYSLHQSGDGKFRYRIENGGNAVVDLGVSTAAKWVYLLGYWKGAAPNKIEGLAVWFNGAWTVTEDAGGSGGPIANPGSLTLGASAVAVPSYHCSGDITGVSLWSRAISTAAEREKCRVNPLYTAAGLVAAWPLVIEAGNTVTDISGNAMNLTLGAGGEAPARIVVPRLYRKPV